MKSYVYLHGFTSSPRSSKANFLRAKFRDRGLDLEVPALDGGDFEHLTISGQLAILDELVNGRPTVLLGSSMGGYLAALYAGKHPEVERVVLLAPAFDFSERWKTLFSPEAFEAWREKGTMTVFHYGEMRQRELSFEIVKEGRNYPAYPEMTQPALVIHGSRDNVVPASAAKKFQQMRGDSVRLCLVESGHELTDVLPEIWALVEDFLWPRPGDYALSRPR